MSKLTELEQEEILSFISWKSGNAAEPRWKNMPRWLVDIYETDKNMRMIIMNVSMWNKSARLENSELWGVDSEFQRRIDEVMK